MQSGNGIITHEDLRNYRPDWRQPVVGQYKHFRVISMPPASSGGVALLQILGMVEPFPLSEMGFHSPKAIHLMVEAERRAYADRAEHLGDTDFYDVPIDSLLDKNYLKSRMSDFSPTRATVSNAILAGNFSLVKETFETTHTSIIDAEGNAVAVTTTLNSNFGCKVWVDGAGFFLNNEMDDFSVKPGVPNQFGLVGAEANAIHPGKRMLSSMTPTIIERDGKVFLVLGARGGSTIITAVFQVFMNVSEFNLNLEAAVNAGRFHHQWLPDEIQVEKGAFNDSTRQALEAKGHRLREVNYMAVVKAIQRLPNGQLHGVGDPRNPDDTARGY
ncbi:MAG TPA: gamma-glutamyltransferase [Saprospiraceae bacterium]|nr:gamma-glutamyltransferase [Saprospiraceae bacterium]